MTDAITSREFYEASGVEDWRVLIGGAFGYFRTENFANGMKLAEAIAELAEAADHHPSLDLRYSGLTVGLTSHDVSGLSTRDVELARAISAAAKALGILADPSVVHSTQVSIDALSIPAVRPFWRAILGYIEDGDEDLVDPYSRGPTVWFQQMDSPRPQRNRIHLDLSVPQDQVEARMAAAIAAGGRLLTSEYAPAWWVVADPEGNEACLTTWQGREGA